MVSLLSSVRAASRWVIGVGSQNPKSPSGTVAVGLLRDVSPGFGEFRSCVPYAREDGRPPDGLEQLGAARKMLESPVNNKSTDTDHHESSTYICMSASSSLDTARTRSRRLVIWHSLFELGHSET